MIALLDISICDGGDGFDDGFENVGVGLLVAVLEGKNMGISHAHKGESEEDEVVLLN